MAKKKETAKPQPKLTVEERAQKRLEKDRVDCWAEIEPILAEYNLIIVGRLQSFPDGLLSVATLARAPEKPEQGVEGVKPAPPAPKA